jgi:dihydrolipoamide dehydrogenase
VDVVLAALGRRPNVEALELGAAGVALDDHGQPVIDPVSLRAGAAPLFLAGDVQPDRPLMHEAADEGVIAARGALAVLDGAVAQLPARRTPITIVFSDPDICAVGTGWDQLDRQRTVVGSAEGSGNGRSKILGAQDNLVRIYADRASGRLLGASLISTHGEHLAHLLAWAVQRAESVTTLLAMPYYHPSVEEMVQSALKDAAQQLATAQT